MTAQREHSTEPDSRRSSSQPIELRDNLRRQLAAYAAAAGAACAGVLGLAQPAGADIIVNTNPISIGINTTVPFPINGVIEFTFKDTLTSTAIFRNTLNISRGMGNVMASHSVNTSRGPFSYALRLGKGAVIGPAGPFAKHPAKVQGLQCFIQAAFGTCFYAGWGSLAGTATGYVGFEFPSNGQTHFGWAHAQVFVTRGSVTATINEFAYDTVANQSILAGQATATTPEPGTLGLLALGSLGLGFWQRKKQSA